MEESWRSAHDADKEEMRQASRDAFAIIKPLLRRTLLVYYHCCDDNYYYYKTKDKIAVTLRPLLEVVKQLATVGTVGFSGYSGYCTKSWAVSI